MRDDEIVAEVRKTREQLSAAAGHDLDGLVEQLKTIEAAERARGGLVLPPAPGAATRVPSSEEHQDERPHTSSD